MRDIDNTVNKLAHGKELDEVLDTMDKLFDKAQKGHKLLQQVEGEHAVNMASNLAYKKAGIKQLIWYTRQDERVCATCGELHGQVFNVDRVPTIPAHPHCRCRLVIKK